MAIETRIIRSGRRIPVVAFFGTKGGVGKTTIARRFAELVTLAPSRPNVLLVDADVYHRGMTVEMTARTPVSCKTVHDYIASQNTSDVEAVDMTGVVRGARPDSGRLVFVPASAPESDHVFDEAAKIGPEPMLRILHEVFSQAVDRYRCECVVIDCGPIIDPYTAAAATLSDRAFIIGQNEPISFSSLKTYPGQIRDFYPEFTTAKMKVVINKVRGWEMLEQRRLHEDIFAAIPFTMDIVDLSEGLSATNDMQLMLFEDHIAQVVEKVFSADHPELIPDRLSSLPPQWKTLLENAGRLERSPKMKRLKGLRLLLPIGLLVLVVGAVLFFAGAAERHRAERAERAAALVAALETAAAEADPAAADALRRALRQAEQVEPGRGDTLAAAVAAAREAGLDEIPPVRRGDTRRETGGMAAFFLGLVVASIGFACARSRRSYLTALQGLRRGGAPWLMAELKAKRSARKTFDRLLRMARA